LGKGVRTKTDEAIETAFGIHPKDGWPFGFKQRNATDQICTAE
jgi:hypothetical protein